MHREDRPPDLPREAPARTGPGRGLRRAGGSCLPAASLVRPLAFAAWTRSIRLQDGFTSEQAQEQTRSVRAELERALLLTFDDFGKGHFTPWVMQEYSSLFDYREMAGPPTFLTTNLSPKQMREQFGDYLVGRMLAHCQVLQVEGTDTRFIFFSKMEEKAANST